jgi:hypothetical protein
MSIKAMLANFSARASNPLEPLRLVLKHLPGQHVSANDSRAIAESSSADDTLPPSTLSLMQSQAFNKDVHSLWQSGIEQSYAALDSIDPPWPIELKVRVQIGAEIWDARTNGTSRPLHWLSGAKLIAVLDTQSQKIYFRDDVDPQDLQQLSMQVMPASAAARPAGFHQESIWDLLWLFAMHSPDALVQVPAQITQGVLQLRRLPMVSPALIEPGHMQLLGTLLKNNLSFQQIAQNSDRALHLLCHDIAALALTKSIQTIK